MSHIKSATILVVTAFLLLAKPGFASSSGAELEAENIVLRYFNALTQGDTVAVHNLIGGDLLVKRSLLLENPTYSEYLIDTFKQARIVITNHKTLDNGMISIEATISMSPSPDDSMKKYFLLEKQPDPNKLNSSFVIVSESSKND